MVSTSRVFFLPLWGMSSSSWHVPDPAFLVEVFSLYHWYGSWCGPIGPNFVYRNSESCPKFRCKMRLSGVNRMREDGVYPSCVPSFLYGGCRVQVGMFQIQFFWVEVVSCSIGVVRGVVQVVQNWFTGIPNPARSSDVR